MKLAGKYAASLNASGEIPLEIQEAANKLMSIIANPKASEEQQTNAMIQLGELMNVSGSNPYATPQQ